MFYMKTYSLWQCTDLNQLPTSDPPSSHEQPHVTSSILYDHLSWLAFTKGKGQGLVMFDFMQRRHPVYCVPALMIQISRCL